MLVALDGKDYGWLALDQARRISEIEGSNVVALHVLSKSVDDDSIRSGLDSEFERWQQESNQSAKLYFESGPVNETLNKRAAWNDLLVFSLERPLHERQGSRMPGRTRNLIRNCPRPLLAVPAITGMKHGLLAYDGSPKSTEALYLAAYLAEKWGIKLTVVTAAEDNMSRENPLDKARDYLSARDIEAHYHTELGQPADVIINIQAIHDFDFLIVGGFGYQPVMEVLFGSTLDGLLQTAEVPILICH